MMRRRLVIAMAAFAASCAGSAFGQSAPIPIRNVVMPLDSGVVSAPAGRGNPGVAVPVYTTWVNVHDSAWLRLKFDQVVLSGNPEQGTGSYIRIFSALDGGVQKLDARHLADWSYSSAVFNGDSLLLEIYAYPGTGANRLSMTTVMASEPVPQGGPDTICGTLDNRTLSSDPRQGRLWPIGCTAWLIDNGNCANRFLTAGHCITNGGGAGDIVQFNVPLSTAGGIAVAPPPQDQFPVVAGSPQSTNGGAIGSDAAQFFTGLSAGQHARVHMGGAAYTLAAAAPGAGGATIRVTGYGTTNPNDPPGGGLPLNQSLVQKTHTGPNVAPVGTNIRYTVDTTGGNSGSPVDRKSVV